MLGRDVRRLSAPDAFLKGSARVFDLFGVLSGDEQITAASSRLAAQIGQRAPVIGRKAVGGSRADLWIKLKPRPGSEQGRTS